MESKNKILKFTKRQILVFVTIIIYIFIIIFRIGGNHFIFWLNGLLTPALAITITGQLALILRQTRAQSQSRKLWTGMLIGWIFWSIAEIWWAYATFTGDELPYPSGADILWLIGYIPMYFALVVRFQTLPKIEKSSQRLMIWGSIAIVSLLTLFFILIPTIQNFDPASVLENTLNFIYPLTDLVLMVLVLRIFFNLQGGLNGRAWVWMSIAFLILSFSDLLFSYGNMHDLYTQSSEGDLFSLLVVDLPYNISYMFVVIGLYHLRKMHRSYQPMAIQQTNPSPVANCHILIFTDANDFVTDISNNSRFIFSSASIINQPFTQMVRNLNANDLPIFETIHSQKTLPDQKAILNSLKGPINIKISGEALMDYANTYLGGIFLVRTVVENEEPDQLLTEYQKGIVNSIMKKAGGEANELVEKKEYLTQIYLPKFITLYNLALGEGGSLMADAFLYEIREFGRSKNWDIGLRVERMLDLSQTSPSEAQIAVPALFEQARIQIVNILDETTVTNALSSLSFQSTQTSG